MYMVLHFIEHQRFVINAFNSIQNLFIYVNLGCSPLLRTNTDCSWALKKSWKLLFSKEEKNANILFPTEWQTIVLCELLKVYRLTAGSRTVGFAWSMDASTRISMTGLWGSSKQDLGSGQIICRLALQNRSLVISLLLISFTKLYTDSERGWCYLGKVSWEGLTLILPALNGVRWPIVGLVNCAMNACRLSAYVLIYVINFCAFKTRSEISHTF